jgi:argininosuccinate lyase
LPTTWPSAAPRGRAGPGWASRLAAAEDAPASAARFREYVQYPLLTDVHVAFERVLTERLGDLGARVHAGRSRNDLVATDLRLWTKDAASGLAALARTLIEALAVRAEEHAGTLIPGYTHLQRARPATLGHHLLARTVRAGATSSAWRAPVRGRTCPRWARAGQLDPQARPFATAAALRFGASSTTRSTRCRRATSAVEFLSACLATARRLATGRGDRAVVHAGVRVRPHRRARTPPGSA